MAALTELKKVVINVKRADCRELNVHLTSPFTCTTLWVQRVGNVGIRIELTDGSVGWGETPTLPPMTAENQPLATAKIKQTCDFLKNSPAMTLGSMLSEIGWILPGHPYASVSCKSLFFYCHSFSHGLNIFLLLNIWKSVCEFR